MNANKNAASRAYIQETRPEVRKSARTAYGLLRIFLVVYGGIIALCFLRAPFYGRTFVPDFALDIFMTILVMLALSEIWLRTTEYSCKKYKLPEENGNENCKKEKDSFLIRFAFWIFPFRGIHMGLLFLWFFLATYYLLLCGLGISGEKIMCPENFPLSFFIVAGACIFDFASKGIFIFRIPGLSGLVAEFAETAIRSDGNIPSRILDAFLKIFRKISFGKKLDK